MANRGGPFAKIGPMQPLLLFADKVLLGHSRAHLCAYLLPGWFHPVVAKLRSYDRDSVACKA